MKLALMAMALTALVLPANAQMVTLTPEQIGEIFCMASIGNDMAPVTALLTADMAAAISDAVSRNDASIAAAPGDKPPLGDGLPWRSQPDYAHKCEVMSATVSVPHATVELRYSVSGAPDTSYINALNLRQVEVETGLPAFWRIDDIDFQADGGTMRQALLDAFQS